jgi:putative RecB family exonuclease
LTQYSHSRLSSFENCPRQFAYRYLEKLPVETEGVEAFVGKRVHEILERLNHHVARYGRPPSLRRVLERFRSDWAAAWHERIEIVRSDTTPASWEERGARCLENYYRAHYPFSDGASAGIEERLQFKLDPAGRYRLVGIVDRIVARDGGRYEIHDYKTGSRLPTQAQVDRERQLALYQIGLEQTYGDVEEVELVWHYLVHGRSLRSRRTPAQLDTLRQETMALIDAIESERSFAPRPGPLCRWCDFKGICPEASQGDGSRPGSRAPGLRPPADLALALEAPAAPLRDASHAGLQLSLLD